MTNTENLLFSYPASEFVTKFLGDETWTPINTMLTSDDYIKIVHEYCDYFAEYMNITFSTDYVPCYFILLDLIEQHESMQDRKYSYKIVYSYVEMRENEENLVFLRVTKIKKEEK